MILSSPSSSPQEGERLVQALKEFSLETERLQSHYHALQERFKEIQHGLRESHIRSSAKLVELDFISHYLDAILQAMSQGLIFIDLNGVVTTYNTAAENLMGVLQKQILFHPFTDFFPENVFGFSLQEIFDTKQAPSTSFFSWTHQGKVKEMEVEATFVSMSQAAYPIDIRQAAPSSIQGLLVLIRDVTAMRRLQQTANLHDRLSQIGELAAHLAHEIRNPLGGIKGFASLLKGELADKPDLQQMATAIVQGADHLDRCVSNVLQYARPFQMQIENVNLMALIEEVKSLIQADKIWGPTLTFEWKTSLASLFLPLDPQLFKSALLNLFVNAIQAMPNGGKLSILIEADAYTVTVRVQDTGEGILPENLSRVFSPFFTTKEKGNGLGLAEVRKVIQAHHGWMDVQSERGKGTTFIIKLPLKVGENV